MQVKLVSTNMFARRGQAECLGLETYANSSPVLATDVLDRKFQDKIKNIQTQRVNF